MGSEEIASEAKKITIFFFRTIPKIREYLETELQAAYDGNPAAFSKNEILLSYPGIYAITINRIAYELYLLSVPLIPRIMTEYIHNKTGIDIHPGITIGKYFFVDHGTGIVIGESAEIGETCENLAGCHIGCVIH